MASRERPLSPFMLGPHYKPQLTSVLSISHRLTGVVLSLTGMPLLLWWLVSVLAGPEAYAELVSLWAHPLLIGLIAVNVFSLFYHLLNGIRHLLWDAGWLLDLKGVYASGWTVVILAVVLTLTAMGVWL